MNKPLYKCINKHKSCIICMVRLKKYAYNINFYAQSPLQSLSNDTIIATSNEKKDQDEM